MLGRSLVPKGHCCFPTSACLAKHPHSTSVFRAVGIRHLRRRICVGRKWECKNADNTSLNLTRCVGASQFAGYLCVIRQKYSPVETNQPTLPPKSIHGWCKPPTHPSVPITPKRLVAVAWQFFGNETVVQLENLLRRQNRLLCPRRNARSLTPVHLRRTPREFQKIFLK